MTYDAADQGVLLFGGGSFAPLGDTWFFQGGSWTRWTELVSPAWRSDSALVYDPRLNASVLYGGSGNTSYLGDTWEFSGDAWHPVTDPIGPPNATDFGMAYDPLLGAVVLTGGGTLVSEPVSLTYSFNDTGWHNLTGELGPANAPRTHHQGATWDAWDHYLLSFGGVVAGNLSDATWLLDALNVTASTTAHDNELPFTVGVSASLSGGAGRIRTWWNLSLAPSPLSARNGSIAVWGIGNHTLLFTAQDAFGETVSVGPFSFRAYAPVTVNVTGGPLAGPAPLAVDFSAHVTGGLAPYTYLWSWGDTSDATDASVPHEYARAGSYLAFLVVTDSFGRTARWQQNVSVRTAPATGGSASSSGGFPNLPTIALLGGAAGVALLAVGAVLWRVRRGRQRLTP